MKIIELQLKLDEGERERQAALNNWNTQKHNYETVILCICTWYVCTCSLCISSR